MSLRRCEEDSPPGVLRVRGPRMVRPPRVLRCCGLCGHGIKEKGLRATEHLV